MLWKSKIKESYDNLNISNKNIGRSNLALSISVVLLLFMVMTPGLLLGLAIIIAAAG